MGKIVKPSDVSMEGSWKCGDHINTVDVTTESPNEILWPFYPTFIHFQCTFDILNHTAICIVFREKCVPDKMARSIIGLYKNSFNCRVLHEGT